jgi:hypothetical protein
MADEKKGKGIEEAAHLPGGVTHDAVKEADKSSGPYIFDAEAHDPPVRTNRPETPIAQTLVEGAGKHMPPDDPHIGADGRFYADPADARTASVGYLNEDQLDERWGKAKAVQAKS